MLISFGGFSLYARLTGRIFSPNKIDIFKDLDQISFYFSLIDPELSQQINTLDTIISDYLHWENVLQTRKSELFQLRSYAKDRKNYLSKVGFSHYQKAFSLLEQARPLRAEIFQLLWETQTFNYLIPLQNSNEARPNWWFFGSFAFVSLSGGHITDLQIVDSYLPDYISPNTRLELPSRMSETYGTKNFGFIAGNKFGFTDKDWKNLKTLYEKIFHTDYDPSRKAQMFSPQKRNQLFEKNIKGVVFLDSELLTYLLPNFRNKAREWQFVNANIDLIRGEARSNKKELYIADLEKYLKQNALKLATSTLNNFQSLLHKWYINIYLSNVSPQMRDFLRNQDLTTVYDSDFLYFFSTNIANNKSDAFLKKQIEILTPDGSVLLSTEDRKLDISSLKSGNYRLAINYTFDLPKTYIDEMLALQKKYNITMTDREKYILALQNKHPDPTIPLRHRESRETIHFPSHREIASPYGDLYNTKKTKSDFSQVVTFQTAIQTTPSSKRILIDFTIP